MTTYYIQENNKIVLADENLQRLQNTLVFTPQYAGLPILETENIIVEGVMYTQEEWKAKLAQEEHERIQELYMTRGDFFAGTIRAFGADDEDLLPIIQGALESAGIPEVEKKVAMSYFRNALDFYRKHPLFAMLTDVPIAFTEDMVVTITSEQWDKFFDETDKKNPDAYKELLPSVDNSEGVVNNSNQAEEEKADIVTDTVGKDVNNSGSDVDNESTKIEE